MPNQNKQKVNKLVEVNMGGKLIKVPMNTWIHGSTSKGRLYINGKLYKFSKS